MPSACFRFQIFLARFSLALRTQCMMELFVFLQMGSSVDEIELCFVQDSAGGGEALKSDVMFFEKMFDDFDVLNAQCFDPVQRDQLLGIIGAARHSILCIRVYPSSPRRWALLAHRGRVRRACGVQQRTEGDYARTGSARRGRVPGYPNAHDHPAPQ